MRLNYLITLGNQLNSAPPHKITQLPNRPSILWQHPRCSVCDSAFWFLQCFMEFPLHSWVLSWAQLSRQQRTNSLVILSYLGITFSPFQILSCRCWVFCHVQNSSYEWLSRQLSSKGGLHQLCLGGMWLSHQICLAFSCHLINSFPV